MRLVVAVPHPAIMMTPVPAAMASLSAAMATARLKNFHCCAGGSAMERHGNRRRRERAGKQEAREDESTNSQCFRRVVHFAILHFKYAARLRSDHVFNVIF